MRGAAAAPPRIMTGAEKMMSDLQKSLLFPHPQNLLLKGCAILLSVKGHYIFTTKAVWKEATVCGRYNYRELISKVC